MSLDLDLSLTWKVTRAQQFHWREFHGQRVLYDEATGDTHLLEPVALAVLEFCRDAETAPDYKAIQKAVISLVDFDCDDALQGYCQELLRRLSRLQLIELVD